MAGKSAVMSVRFIADATRFSGELTKVEKAIAGVERGVEKLTPAATVAGGALVAFGAYAGQAAAEAEQNFGAVDTVFKGAADTVHSFAEAAAQSVGMSSSSYESLAASIGGSLSRAGYSQDELASKTNDLISAGADLSSVFGGDAAGAAEAMGAALRGEYDSLEQYGVFMSAAAIEARMAAEGTSELEGAAYDAAKQQATVNEIMAQAGAYQGNFAREADTAAGSQQRAAAEFQNAAATLGALLLPAMTAGANKLAEFARWAQENQDKVAALAIGIGVFVGSVFAAKGAIMAVQGAATAAKIATTAWTAAQWAFNAAMSANPIGLVIIAITALVAAVIWAYNNVDWFREGVDAALNWIKDAWSAAGEWIKNAWSAAVDWVKNTWNAGVDWVIQKFTQMIDNALFVAEFIADSFFQGVEAVKGYFESLYERVKGIFDSIGNFAGNIRDKIAGLFDGFKMPSMPDWAKKIMGGSTFAFGYELGDDGVYYAPGRGVDMEPPFMLTAATDGLAPVMPSRGYQGQTVINNYHNYEFTLSDLNPDPIETARKIKDILQKSNHLVGY
ncbi:hypothetical protein [Rothia sp. ZJ1223]|uniref:phage tail protein n=1 Tax=Rothia sp. ZJ1223 TaxID=2811098 RepID=UPI0019581C3B|nr:hypothetical protein [Rothia sp. ZJ1223]MBM7052216.1 hypothetical protein [Rothia sp. ZJ1223]